MYLRPILDRNLAYCNSMRAPPCLARETFSTFSCLRPQSLGSYHRNHGPTASWSGFDARSAQTFPRIHCFGLSLYSYVSAPSDNRWRQRESLNPVENRCEQLPRDSHFG